MGFLPYALLAGSAPLIAAAIPYFLFQQRRGAHYSYRTTQIMLGISAGLLFAIATVDLIPEAISMSEVSAMLFTSRFRFRQTYSPVRSHMHAN